MGEETHPAYRGIEHLYGFIEGRWPDAEVGEVGAQTLSVEMEGIEVEDDNLPDHIEIRAALQDEVWLRLNDSKSEQEMAELFEQYLNLVHGYDRPNADTVAGDIEEAVHKAEMGEAEFEDWIPYPERLDLE